jgi:putative transcriptional regulator
MSDKVFENLSGKLLVASPYAMEGNVFHRSLVYVLSHTESGSVGLITNRFVHSMSYKSLFKFLSNDPNADNMDLKVYMGGPSEPERAFFLHSGEYNKNLLFAFPDNIAVSSNTDILNDMMAGSGPKESLFLVGYTGWAAGQLENELENNLWIISPFDHNLIFTQENTDKWDRALQKLGIEGSCFNPNIGYC